MNVLHLDSGLFVESSVSRQVSNDVVAKLKDNDNVEVTYRDLVRTPVPHLTADELMAEDKQLINELVDELKATDILVIGAPMYNFTVPTQLKAWIDRVLQAGVTFRYTESGSEGLLEGKRAIIASGRGGVYSNEEMSALDHQEAYLKTVLGFIGITDVDIVRAEGMAISDEAREQGFAQAKKAIAQLG